jgi:hypothetical protein
MIEESMSKRLESENLLEEARNKVDLLIEEAVAL